MQKVPCIEGTRIVRTRYQVYLKGVDFARGCDRFSAITFFPPQNGMGLRLSVPNEKEEAFSEISGQRRERANIRSCFDFV